MSSFVSHFVGKCALSQFRHCCTLEAESEGLGFGVGTDSSGRFICSGLVTSCGQRACARAAPTTSASQPPREYRQTVPTSSVSETWLVEGEGSWVAKGARQLNLPSGQGYSCGPLLDGCQVSRRGRMLRPVPDHKAYFTSTPFCRQSPSGPRQVLTPF